MQDMSGHLLFALLGIPLLAFLPWFTPPEWWRSLHDDSEYAQTANLILWLELRLDKW